MHSQKILFVSALLAVAVPTFTAVRENNQVGLAKGSGGGWLVKPDGTLWAWGAGLPLYQVGFENNWLWAKGGQNARLALREDNTLWAWGQGVYLGNGSSSFQSEPTQVLGSGWVTASIGVFGVAGIKADGTLWTWGYNFAENTMGREDDGSYTPGQVLHVPAGPSNNNWVSVFVGQGHMIALKSDGTLWGWGDNFAGQVGNGNQEDQRFPIQIGTDRDWIALPAGVEVGGSTSMALKSDGTLWSWGWNFRGGLLGTGTTSEMSLTPRQIPGGNWKSVTIGKDHALALKSNGTLYAWGSNQFGQHGNGTTSGVQRSPIGPMQPSSFPPFIEIEAGEETSFGVTADGTLWSWGNPDKALGRTDGNYTSPGVVATSARLGRWGAGQFHSGWIRANGTLWTYGPGTNGKLGLGNTNAYNTPRQVVSTSPSVANNYWGDFKGGGNHSLALRADGTIWSCGNNGVGQLGRSVTTSAPSTRLGKIGSDNKWKLIAPGKEHNLALKVDGTLWAWGYNGSGQIGNGNNTTNPTAPAQITTTVPVSPSNDWVWISGGTSHSAGIKADGTLWTWGSNTYGQLGHGNTTPLSRPTKIIEEISSPEDQWVRVECGANHTVALRSDGVMLAWGRNEWGQIGHGSTGGIFRTPTRIGEENQWVQLSAARGGNFTLAISAAGPAYAWGENQAGQLGNGENTTRNLPYPLSFGYWRAVYNGAQHAFGASVGVGYAWGFNGSGQLGLGDYYNRNWPSFFNMLAP